MHEIHWRGFSLRYVIKNKMYIERLRLSVAFCRRCSIIGRILSECCVALYIGEFMNQSMILIIFSGFGSKVVSTVVASKTFCQ